MSLFSGISGTLGKALQAGEHVVTGIGSGVAKGATTAVAETAGGVSRAATTVVGAPVAGIEDAAQGLVGHVATVAGTGLGAALLVRRLGMPPTVAATFGGLIGAIAGQVFHLVAHHQLASLLRPAPNPTPAAQPSA